MKDCRRKYGYFNHSLLQIIVQIVFFMKHPGPDRVS